jgi:pantetheine-phosphate adenylyltransferase
MLKTALFPGSFDPVTIGHWDIVKRSTSLFDRVIVGIGTNSEKRYMFDAEKRYAMAQEAFGKLERVEVIAYSGLTVDCCIQHQAHFIIRGVRNAADYEFEKSIAAVNHALNPVVETVFLMAKPEHVSISSTIIRDIIRNGGNAGMFIPDGVKI